jgi:hypothetical protein
LNGRPKESNQPTDPFFAFVPGTCFAFVWGLAVFCLLQESSTTKEKKKGLCTLTVFILVLLLLSNRVVVFTGRGRMREKLKKGTDNNAGNDLVAKRFLFKMKTPPGRSGQYVGRLVDENLET